MNDDDTDALLTERSARTQHGLTRSEMIQGMANRFMYSQFYIILYLCLAILSLVSIVLVRIVGQVLMLSRTDKKVV